MRLFDVTDLVETVHCWLASTDLGFLKDDTLKIADVEPVPPTFLTTTLKNVVVADPTAVVLHP